MRIDGVPEYITRDRYKEMIAALGFDPMTLRWLEWRPDGVYAEVCAVDEQGAQLVDYKQNEVVTHRVFVRVKDES